ncbi:MAG: hypothetical protein HON98_06770 [Chloroflexi bacterium]|jgi:hypothetical protein|nr:hypothetical protein [Chloroflexota bacterium]MBT3669397.1 hypothetical protein [Chloroflexota bacterium]MBT4003291.1 hypothetical protein [Chloroflexota bacterium]MBT4304584.1 hypothetical protein [Chloroflexota bacterium]MBT4534075.1 hypothetical protein [Chloroflexota bacterium]
MSDLFDDVTEDQDPFKRLLSKIPGFGGYIERQNRRAADKILRELIGERFRAIWKRVGEVQQDLVSQGEILQLDDIEKAATKIQTFIDKVENAAYGYSSFFEAEKINEEELKSIYEFDVSLLALEDDFLRAVENIESSFGSDGLPASISHLVTLSRDLVETFGKRDNMLIEYGKSSSEEAGE